MDPRTRRLLEDPIGPTLLRLALPNVLLTTVQTSIGLIETYFVAKLGTDALAGIALVFPLLMLVQMMSSGAMGGGISSAIARALGSGRRDTADILVWHAVAIAVGLGVLTSLTAWLAGPPLYAAMGGTGPSLTAALAYSDAIFAGAILIWLFNSLANVIRGTGNMLLPAAVTCVGAALLIPLSAALILGFGSLPRLGIIGGALAVIVYYAVGSVVYTTYLWSGRSVLSPARHPPQLRWADAYEILRIGAIASLIAVTTNITIAVATALVGRDGPAAVAGYGTGVRLEYLLIPLVFGLGAPLVAMVGTNIGAGRQKRALRVAWTGATIAVVVTETIGVAAALHPYAWLGLFGDDPDMLAAGAKYLRIVGPFYGFLGGGMALYFAAQGAGRMGWPLAIAFIRLFVAAVGGSVAFWLTGAIASVFVALGVALALFGLLNAITIWAGAWRQPKRDEKPSSVDVIRSRH
ncbi:MAG: MATE family efflux transporter [Hyphomicrobiales bacterium]|nr:MATE family efflux transporter [Hyphomicrobiales bacterium]